MCLSVFIFRLCTIACGLGGGMLCAVVCCGRLLFGNTRVHTHTHMDNTTRGDTHLFCCVDDHVHTNTAERHATAAAAVATADVEAGRGRRRDDATANTSGHILWDTHTHSPKHLCL